MGFSLFSNSHFQMGVTVMGFGEHFGPSLIFFLIVVLILKAALYLLLNTPQPKTIGDKLAGLTCAVADIWPQWVIEITKSRINGPTTNILLHHKMAK